MAPLASHVVPDLQPDIAGGSTSPFVLSPISPTGSAHLRRAAYVRVSDLARPFNIDEEKLSAEIAKVEAAGDSAEAASGTEGGEGKANVNEALSSGKDGETAPRKISDSSKENIGEGQYHHRSSQQKLVPPSGGFNLCLLVGKLDVVVDKLRVDRSRVRLAEVEVGDETGCVSLRARDDQIDVLKEISDRSGAVVIRNCTLELYQGRHLRLAVTKWGKLSPFPDHVPSTPPQPLNINRRMKYSAVDLNLVVGEIRTPSSPETANHSSSTSSSQGLHQTRPSPYHSSHGEGFEDVGVGPNRAKGGGSRSHQNRGQQHRRGGRERKHQQHHRQGHKSGRGTPPKPYTESSPRATMPAAMVAPGMPYSPVYTAASAAEVPQYGFSPSHHRGDDRQRQYADFEADHHQKQQQLIAQHYELQQRHFEQMQVYHHQQERHRRMFEGQQPHQIQQHPSPLIAQDILRAGSPVPLGSRILPTMAGVSSVEGHISQHHAGSAGEQEFHQSSVPASPGPSGSSMQHPGATLAGRGQTQHGREGMHHEMDQQGADGSISRQRGHTVPIPSAVGVPTSPMGAWHGRKLPAGIMTPPASPGRMNPQAATFAPSYAESPSALNPPHQQVQPSPPIYGMYDPMQATGPMYGSPMTPHHPYSQGAPYIPAIHDTVAEGNIAAGPAHQGHNDSTVSGAKTTSAIEKKDVASSSETHEMASEERAES